VEIEETTIDKRDNILHQIDIDNNTTNREKAIVEDIEIMIGGTNEKTDTTMSSEDNEEERTEAANLVELSGEPLSTRTSQPPPGD
jgi:hypothetical protein